MDSKGERKRRREREREIEYERRRERQFKEKNMKNSWNLTERLSTKINDLYQCSLQKMAQVYSVNGWNAIYYA